MEKINILAEAIKKAGEATKAKHIWVVDPMIESIMTAFANYVGMQTLAANGEPLVVVAVRRAFAAFQEYEGFERAARAAFVRSLLSHSKEMFSQLVVAETPRGGIAWMPFACSLTEFLQMYPGVEIDVIRTECKIDESITRTFLMTKIIPAALLDQASLAELLGDPAELS